MLSDFSGVPPSHRAWICYLISGRSNDLSQECFDSNLNLHAELFWEVLSPQL